MSIENWNDGATQSIDLLNQLPIKFFVRILINFLAVLILFRWIYYPRYKNADNVFTYFIFSTIIFLITYLLNRAEMSIGAAFGLFAVFTMLRYRTENISAKDMTYMFIAISLGLINAISKGGWDEFIMINVIVILATRLLESNLLFKRQNTKTVVYDNIALIKREKLKELLEDLEVRLGKKIHHVDLGDVDFLKDSVIIKVSYFD